MYVCMYVEIISIIFNRLLNRNSLDLEILVLTKLYYTIVILFVTSMILILDQASIQPAIHLIPALIRTRNFWAITLFP